MDHRAGGPAVGLGDVARAVGEQVVAAAGPDDRAIGRGLGPHGLGDLRRVEVHVVAEGERGRVGDAERPLATGVLARAGVVALHRQDHAPAVAGIPGRIADVVVALRLRDARRDSVVYAGRLPQLGRRFPQAPEDSDEEEVRLRRIGGEALPVGDGDRARSGQNPAPGVLPPERRAQSPAPGRAAKTDAIALPRRTTRLYPAASRDELRRARRLPGAPPSVSCAGWSSAPSAAPAFRSASSASGR